MKTDSPPRGSVAGEESGGGSAPETSLGVRSPPAARERCLPLSDSGVTPADLPGHLGHWQGFCSPLGSAERADWDYQGRKPRTGLRGGTRFISRAQGLPLWGQEPRCHPACSSLDVVETPDDPSPSLRDLQERDRQGLPDTLGPGSQHPWGEAPAGGVWGSHTWVVGLTVRIGDPGVVCRTRGLAVTGLSTLVLLAGWATLQVSLRLHEVPGRHSHHAAERVEPGGLQDGREGAHAAGQGTRVPGPVTGSGI